ncbi:MAG: hypothetical protein NTW21_24455 [Verrucomicrobia bacterium]|nr:hypothetical protein [Verrucomicrobiota bacterium]
MQPSGSVLKGLRPGEVAKKSPSGDQTLGLDSPSQEIEIVNSRRLSSCAIRSAGTAEATASDAAMLTKIDVFIRVLI